MKTKRAGELEKFLLNFSTLHEDANPFCRGIKTETAVLWCWPLMLLWKTSKP